MHKCVVIRVLQATGSSSGRKLSIITLNSTKVIVVSVTTGQYRIPWNDANSSNSNSNGTVFFKILLSQLPDLQQMFGSRKQT
jgi:hypothetical protein